MFFKIIFFTVICFTFGYSSYEKVRIGYIDSYYKDKITQSELKTIIKEIENIFESQLGFNVFDYEENGKPIDLLYLPPSKKRFNFNKSMKESQRKKEKIVSLQEMISNKQKRLSQGKIVVEKEYKLLNKDINSFNNYINKINSREITSKTEYNQVKKDIAKRKRELEKKQDRFNQKKTKYNSTVRAYNQLTTRYNILVKQYNRLQRKIEILSRSIKEIKGAAKGYTQTTFKTFVKNGKTYTEKKQINYMEKIEIYGFENKAQLKAILAHELAHLVGAGHVKVKGALMNPILQENQIKNLKLTPEDIKEFRRSF